jgi:amidohydrolase
LHFGHELVKIRGIIHQVLATDMRNFRHEIEAYQSDMIAMRRDLHQHPELSYEEYRTAGIVADTLNGLGLEVQTGIAKTGVVGVLEGGSDGPTVLLRCDMDALPLQEENQTDYISTVDHKMHACGHDGHTAIALTVARTLAAHRDEIKGRVKFVFQPAEEEGTGAKTMIAEGVLNAPAPDVCVGLHLWNELPHGEVAVVPGPIMSGCDNTSVEIKGFGGHAALPHVTRDPIVALAHIITSLQSIVSRNVPPLETAVISVTQLQAGDAFNIIPERARFTGTIRTFDPAVRERVLERFKTVITQTAALMQCEAVIDIDTKTLPVVNDASVASRLLEGYTQVEPGLKYNQSFRTMASEDMAYFLNNVPGTYLLVGSANPARGLDYPHHHPRFDFDEDALVTGASLLASAVADYLMPG